MKKALFIFRRDLRLTDNTGLIFALKQAQEVIPCFIFTPEQIEHNPYRGDHCLQFMIESLEELGAALESAKGKLYLFYGKPDEIVDQCVHHLKVDAVVLNRDYTPYSLKRDEKIEKRCRQLDVAFHSFDDLLLHPPEETVKAGGAPYQVFTPFYRNASRLEVPFPRPLPQGRYVSAPIPFSLGPELYEKILPKRALAHRGGRKAALRILKELGHFSAYAVERDFPAKEKTTHLSAHLKFTTCSVREAYWAISSQLGDSSELIRALYWRDFFTSIAFHFPRVFHGAFREEFNQLPWDADEGLFKKWCAGETGFPIVDAGMRELNQTGFMHNRVRMIAASFLVKDLHIDWRRGERYFAQQLVDYDPAVNNGNWQWVASTGCDAQPYFRIFNPWTQSLKFDPNCVYIKQWVPELEAYLPKQIHHWDKAFVPGEYPSPLVDHGQEAKRALAGYKRTRG